MDFFEIGDRVEIVVPNGQVFDGWLEDFTEAYVIVGGLGFPMEDIEEMRPA
jgi:hypothetical protein